MRKPVRILFIVIFSVYCVPMGASWLAHTFTSDVQASDWRTARRDSAGIAPSVAPDQAAIQAWCARAFRWRGAFGEHCWISTKKIDDNQWTRFEVTGWAVRRGGKAVQVARGVPDGYWYGAKPTLIRAIHGGTEVETWIERLHAASDAYPHNAEYRIWPGPNSNTYIAYLGRAVPELSLDLPPTAIGKDFIPQGGFVATAPSGSGVQMAFGGLFGLILAPQEGLEMNLLGLSAGIDAWPPALKLPGLGRIGFPSEASNEHGSADEPGKRSVNQTDQPG